MIPRWTSFDVRQRQVFQTALVFLKGRADSAETVVWALKISSAQEVLRASVMTMIDDAIDDGLGDPWRSAWRLIEEAWQEPVQVKNAGLMAAVRANDRVRQGDRSGTLIREIVELVKPRLEVGPAPRLDQRSRRWRPRRLGDLVRASLTSGELQTAKRLALDTVADADFLCELARALDTAVHQGLDTARRFGWDGKSFHAIGSLERVEMIPKDAGQDRDQADEFHAGIAPSAKLLHAVLLRLAELSPDAAQPIVASFARAKTVVHERLWASFARDPRFATASDVETYLLGLLPQAFWFLHSYPEVAELRATRFGDVSPAAQAAVLHRLKAGPPRNLWRRNIERERFEEMARYWSAREMRRLQIGGSVLPPDVEGWLHGQLAELNDLAAANDIDEGFPGTYDAFDTPAPGDDGYGLLSGRERLSRLEQALRTTREGWGDDPSDRAVAWIGDPRNALSLITDFESLPAGERDYPEVWDRFGVGHQPQSAGGPTNRDLADEARRVLDLIATLSDEILGEAVDGFSDWLSDWSRHLKEHPLLAEVWLRLWPYAVAKTNAQQPDDEAPSLNVIIQSRDDREPRDLDTYNTAVGRMAGAFLGVCPNLNELEWAPAFPPDAVQTRMRDALVTEGGRAGLIASHRMLEHLSYFRRADPEWTQANLLPSLTGDDVALPLWNAVVRRTISNDVLAILAPFMLQRAVDLRLPRETRRGLAFRLVVESLHALYENREPLAPPADVQRMLRELDDEVRARAAEAAHRFLRDMATDGKTKEELFAAAVNPFLRRIWPQERSLTTPGVSRAFADIPAAAGDMFVAAVDAVERFLVPFDAWSMIEFGLYGEDEDHNPRLALVDTPAKADAFLRLLNCTIGTSEGAVIPTDLSAALQHIQTLAPHLSENHIYRRLATAARL